MKKILLTLTILVFIFGIFLYFQQEPQVPEEISSSERLKNLSSIILENTEFKNFRLNNFSFKYPDWQKIEIDPLLIWPREIAEKQQLLLYLTNSDKVKLLVTKREVETEYLEKPYPLILRETFAKDREILEKWEGITDWLIIREKFFENGVLIESRVVVFGTTNISFQQSIIINENNSRFIYSVGISAQEEIFKDYRLLAEYIINSIRYY